MVQWIYWISKCIRFLMFIVSIVNHRFKKDIEAQDIFVIIIANLNLEKIA